MIMGKLWGGIVINAMKIVDSLRLANGIFARIAVQRWLSHRKARSKKMIKIIKAGTRRKAMCDECGCIFSYEAEDIKHLEKHNGENHLVDGTKSGFKSCVICPQCHNGFIISQIRCISTESEEI